MSPITLLTFTEQVADGAGFMLPPGRDSANMWFLWPFPAASALPAPCLLKRQWLSES